MEQKRNNIIDLINDSNVKSVQIDRIFANYQNSNDDLDQYLHEIDQVLKFVQAVDGMFKNVLLIDKNKKIDKRDLEDQIDFDEEDDDGDNDDDNDDDIINKYNPNDDDNDDDEEEDSDEIIKENKTKTFKK